jgi:hypothetical protein
MMSFDGGTPHSRLHFTVSDDLALSVTLELTLLLMEVARGIAELQHLYLWPRGSTSSTAGI